MTVTNIPEVAADSPVAAEEGRLVWDLPVRLFHATLIAAVIGAFVTNRLGVAYFQYHVWCGYAVLVLTVFRKSGDAWLVVAHANFFGLVQ